MSASSPSKRRKKNDGSGQSVRGLDYFFAKQQAAAKNGAKPTVPSEEPKQDEQNGLTDEELARKLQEEWDAEHRAAQDIQKLELGRDSAPSEDPRLPPPATDEKPVELKQKEAPAAIVTVRTATLALQSTAVAEDTIAASIPFDESPLTFEPSKYIPELQQHWASDGGNATYALLTRCFVLVNGTTSRIKIVDTLVNLLRTIIEGDPSSLLPAVWLATNSISPAYIDLELGLGGSAISKALKKVCGLDNNGLKALYNKSGDPGDVAFEAKKRQSFTLKKPKPLTIKAVFESLVKIASSKGTGSVEAKQRIVEKLLQDARGPEESRYIVRTLVQHVCDSMASITLRNNLTGRSFVLVPLRQPC